MSVLHISIGPLAVLAQRVCVLMCVCVLMATLLAVSFLWSHSFFSLFLDVCMYVCPPYFNMTFDGFIIALGFVRSRFCVYIFCGPMDSGGF